MKTSIFKRVGSACMALAIGCTMALGLATTPVKAELTTEGHVQGHEAVITKKLHMTEETNLPEAGLTFKFKFDKVSFKGDQSVDAKNNMPNMPEVIVKIDNNTPSANASGIKTYTAQSENFLPNFMFDENTNGSSYPEVGKYVYEVSEIGKESADNTEILSPEENRDQQLIFSDARYTLEIYVYENGNNVAGPNMTVIVKDLKDNKKVDPAPGQYGMVFENHYIKTVRDNALKITKTVRNDFAANTDKFDFTLKIDNPAIISPDAKQITYSITSDGVVGENVTVVPGDVIQFQLGDGDFITVNNLVVGSPYTITEQGVDEWTATYNINGEVFPGEKGKGLNITNKKIQDQENTVAITNTFNNQTPTGIIMNNLPFISMLVLGLGALTLVTITNSRKRANRA